MNDIYEIARSLTGKEEKKLLKYMGYKSQAKNRKDVMLLKLLRSSKELSSAEMISRLYGSADKKKHTSPAGAYHNLRKALRSQMEDFISLEVKNETNEHAYSIVMFLHIAKFLMNRKMYETAWNYLMRAEKKAERIEDFSLLEQIYYTQIEYAWTQDPNPINLLIEKNRQNEQSAQTNRVLNMALQSIRYQLTEAHKEGNTLENIDLTIEYALKQFNIENIVNVQASARYKIAMIARYAFEEKKDNKSLCDYLIKTYHEMESLKMFEKRHHEYKVSLLNTICVVATRTFRFGLLEEYLKKLDAENELYPDKDLFSIQGYMSRVVLYAYTKRLSSALELLYILKNKYKRIYHSDNYYFIILITNLIDLELLNANPKIARKFLMELLKTERRIINFWGLEGVVNSHIIECIINIELQDSDYAEYRLASIERKYRNYLSNPLNERKQELVRLLKKICKESDPFKDQTFRKRCKDFIGMEPNYEAGVEFVSFNAWLISKLENKSYYEVILEMVSVKVD